MLLSILSSEIDCSALEAVKLPSSLMRSFVMLDVAEGEVVGISEQVGLLELFNILWDALLQGALPQ